MQLIPHTSSQTRTQVLPVQEKNKNCFPTPNVPHSCLNICAPPPDHSCTAPYPPTSCAAPAPFRRSYTEYFLYMLLRHHSVCAHDTREELYNKKQYPSYTTLSASPVTGLLSTIPYPQVHKATHNFVSPRFPQETALQRLNGLQPMWDQMGSHKNKCVIAQWNMVLSKGNQQN